MDTSTTEEFQGALVIDMKRWMPGICWDGIWWSGWKDRQIKQWDQIIRSSGQVNEFGSPTKVMVKSAPLTRSLEPHLELLWIELAEQASKVWKKMFSQNICTTAYDNCYSIDLTKDNYKTAWCRKNMLLVWLWLIHLLVDTDSTWPKIINSQAQLRQDNHLTPSESLTATSTSRIAQQNSGVHCGDLSQKARMIGLPATRTLEVWEPNNETLHEGGQMPFLLKRPGSWNLHSYITSTFPVRCLSIQRSSFHFFVFCVFVVFFLFLLLLFIWLLFAMFPFFSFWVAHVGDSRTWSLNSPGATPLHQQAKFHHPGGPKRFVQDPCQCPQSLPGCEYRTFPKHQNHVVISRDQGAVLTQFLAKPTRALNLYIYTPIE